MTIEEAIKHCEEKSDCTKCGQEHAQLKSWLQELLSYRQFNTAAEVIDKKCPICGHIFWDAYFGGFCPDCGKPLIWTDKKS